MSNLGTAPTDPAVSPPMTAFAKSLQLFRSRWPIRITLGVLGFLVLLAIYAPFLSSEVALVWKDANGLSFPILSDLLNRRAYPKFYDLVFNLLAFTLPISVLVAWRCRWGFGNSLMVITLPPVLLGLLCLIPIPSAHGWKPLWRESALTTKTLSHYGQNPLSSSPTTSAVFTPLGHTWSYTYPGAILLPPGSMNPSTGRAFVLGTDKSGRCVAARMLFGARISLTIGIVATAIAMSIGIFIGTISGHFGGKVDLLLQRLVEIMMCFPTFILVLIVVAALGRDIFYIIIVQGLTGWASDARMVRGEVLVQRQRDYVLAGQSLGLGSMRIMFRHILPNCATPLLISAVFSIAGAALSESGLAFLGLGDPNAPSWGELLDQGRENIHMQWLIWTPGIAVCCLVTTLYILGDGLRRALDPKGQ